MDLGIRHKTAVVVGAGSGLGAASAKALAAEGARVVLVGRREEALQQTASEIQSLGGVGHVLVGDISQTELMADRLNALKASLGPISVLVNNTGGPPPTPASGQSSDLWVAQFQSMVVSVIALTDVVLPDMRAQGWGRILTIASSGVVAPIPNLALSNAMRLSLVGWSKTLSREVASQGITVNMVLPGRIATDRVRFLDESKAKRESKDVTQVEEESCAAIPLGRYGKPEEFGSTVAFLASQQAAYITGSMIRVDGGMIASI